MNDAMKLSEDERALILARRRAERAKKQPEVIFLLELAARFEAWKLANGVGASYSTFCDDFGYNARDGEKRPLTYDRIQQLIDFCFGIIQ